VRALLYADGGARGNPGPAGIGIVLRSTDGDVIGETARGIGVATNNVAEYTALIEGLRLALAKGVTELTVRMDSELVVSQMNGAWKIKSDRLRALAVEAGSLLSQFERWDIEHVGRRHNAEADRLANQGMDAAALDAELGPEWSPPRHRGPGATPGQDAFFR
jgi:probable phosphoglycerate mutase